MKTVTFNSAQEIYDVLDSRTQDLYCIDEEMYLFNYNASGSIAYYYLDMDELMELANEAKANGEDCIAGLLGPGGYIVDTDNYSAGIGFEYDEEITEILDFLEDLVGKEFIYANASDLV